jgi:hypothetical protein
MAGDDERAGIWMRKAGLRIPCSGKCVFNMGRDFWINGRRPIHQAFCLVYGAQDLNDMFETARFVLADDDACAKDLVVAGRSIAFF